MNPVAVAKLIHNNNRDVAYRIVFDNTVEDISAEILEHKIRRFDIRIQNMDLVKSSNSLIGVYKLNFTTGHDYPEIHETSEYYNRNIGKMTLLGYALNENGKMFILSNAMGELIPASNLEIAMLEKYDAITNASYCRDGKVRLDNGIMEEASPEAIRYASSITVDKVKSILEYSLLHSKRANAPKAMGNPNFGRLDALEKQLPNHDKRRESYSSLYNSPELEPIDFSGIGECACLLGLGAASFVLDSVIFAGKMRLGNAILDRILGD